MKIRSLHLKNTGVFEDETITFPEKQNTDGAEIHILTGVNGTGKTTVLQALASGMFKRKPYVDFSNLLPPTIQTYEKLKKRFWSATPSIECSIKLIFDNIEHIEILYCDNVETMRGVDSVGWENNRFNAKLKEYAFKFIAFAYSGYRFIDNEENISITENSHYNPLENALEFNKNPANNDYSLNKWLAINTSKRALAREGEDIKGIERFDRNIKDIEEIINQIIGENKKIKFKANYDNGIKIIIVTKEGQELDFDVLPDGLRSLISWIGDLLMRMDALQWKDDLSVFEREFILFLDEIEVHLHPSWQRKILPVIQRLFKNAQIFITTHSPFIVNSVDGAYIHKLKFTNNGVKATPAIISENGNSIGAVLRDIFDMSEEFGIEPQKELDEFQLLRDKILKGESEKIEDFLRLGKKLSNESLELNTIVQFELRQVNRILKQNWDYAEV